MPKNHAQFVENEFPGLETEIDFWESSRKLWLTFKSLSLENWDSFKDFSIKHKWTLTLFFLKFAFSLKIGPDFMFQAPICLVADSVPLFSV